MTGEWLDEIGPEDVRGRAAVDRLRYNDSSPHYLPPLVSLQ